MEYFDQFLNYFCYSAELMVIALILASSLNKKKHFWMKAGIAIASVLVLSAIFTAALTTYINEHEDEYRHYFSALVYAALTLPINYIIFFCLEEKWQKKVFLLVSIIFVWDIFKWLYEIILFIISVTTKCTSYKSYEVDNIWLLLKYAIMAIILIPISKMYKRIFARNNVLEIDTWISVLFLVALFANFLITPLGRRLYDEPENYIRLISAEEGFDLVTFSMLYLVVRATNTAEEKRMIEKTMKESIQQYNQVKENIDIINRKCHDLRHQLRVASLSKEGLDPDYIKETLDAINIYDCSTKTGNEVLDVILMDKKLQCNAKGIQFNIVADGSCLSFMQREDIISLFSNILENAINYESRITDKENRFISLQVYRKNGFVKIHSENLLSSTLLEKTTEEKDPHYHGYGLLSIKAIVRKYGGNFMDSSTKDVFSIDVLIPAEEEKTKRND